MNLSEYLKLELMLYALEYDYFDYGTVIEKHRNGRYTIYIDGEKISKSKSDLVKDFGELDNRMISEIIMGYTTDNLLKN